MTVTAAQQPVADAPKVVDVEKINDSLYVLRGQGGGGNTAVLVMANGVAVVDADADLVAYGRDGLKAGKTPEQLAAEWKLPEKYQGYSSTVSAMMGGLAGRFAGLRKEIQ